MSWKKKDTAFLNYEAHEKYNVSVEIILLTALIKAINDTTGNNAPVIELENHGRSVDDINVSRTVGWFTSLYPVAFILEGEMPAEQLLSVKEQVKKIPGNGIGYGLLNYMEDGLKPQHVPDFRFNYLGQFDFDAFADLFEISDMNTGSETGSNHITAGVDIICIIREGKLKTTFMYDHFIKTEEAITALKNAYDKNLKLLLEHLKQEQEIYFTPSDFETINLSKEELDGLFG